MTRGVKQTKNEFVFNARIVHGNKYDYSNVDYINSTTKVIIICPEHGNFNKDQQIIYKVRMCPIW